MSSTSVMSQRASFPIQACGTGVFALGRSFSDTSFSQQEEILLDSTNQSGSGKFCHYRFNLPHQAFNALGGLKRGVLHSNSTSSN